MPKNIIVVVGSSRLNGNTNQLADAFINGAESAGNKVTKFHLANMEINACKDCTYCTTHLGECSQKDDMSKIYPVLYQADMIVFASPVYFYGFTAQIKALIDRMLVTMGKAFPITSCILLSPYADTDTTVSNAIIFHFKEIAKFLGWKVKGVLTVSNIYKQGDITGHPCLLEAEILGQSC